jgi:hypothetical protein
MFAHWRSVAAAAGLCLAWALSHDRSFADTVAPQRVVLSPPIPGAQYDAEGYNDEYDGWYQRYYRRYWDEFRPMPAAVPAPAPPLPDSDVPSDAESAGQFNATDDSTDSMDETFLIDAQGRCNDPTCPCHDTVEVGTDLGASGDTNAVIFDIDQFDEMDAARCIDPDCPSNRLDFSIEKEGSGDFGTDEQMFFEDDPEQFDDAEAFDSDAGYPSCPFGRISRHMDVYEPYSYDRTGATRDSKTAVLLLNLMEIDQQVSIGKAVVESLNEQNDGIDDVAEPVAAELIGTIEPLDSAWIGHNPQATSAAGIDTDVSLFDELPDPNDDADAATQRPRLHLFYPGFDWGRYSD